MHSLKQIIVVGFFSIPAVLATDAFNDPSFLKFMGHMRCATISSEEQQPDFFKKASVYFNGQFPSMNVDVHLVKPTFKKNIDSEGEIQEEQEIEITLLAGKKRKKALLAYFFFRAEHPDFFSNSYKMPPKTIMELWDIWNGAKEGRDIFCFPKKDAQLCIQLLCIAIRGDF